MEMGPKLVKVPLNGYGLSDLVDTARGTIFKIDFFTILDKKDHTVPGAGFTVHGVKSTDFWTFSDENPRTLWSTLDDRTHHLHHLCKDGLRLSEDDTYKLVRRWKGWTAKNPNTGTPEVEGKIESVWTQYIIKRNENPPQTYTFTEAIQYPWGKKFVENLSKVGRVPH